jgi:hypothetical protein
MGGAADQPKGAIGLDKYLWVLEDKTTAHGAVSGYNRPVH